MEYMKMKFMIKILFFMEIILLTNCIPQEYDQNYLGVEPPKFFSFAPSPLQQRRTNLRSSPAYFDFLNTLYRHDKTKSDLFQDASSQSAVVTTPVISSPSSSSSSSSSVFGSSIPSSQSSSPASLPLSFSPVVYTPESRDYNNNPTFSSYQNNNPTQSQAFRRNRRAVIFRPLFVYRQQQIKRQRVKTKRF